MIQSKRALHRVMWLGLVILIPLVLILAITQREAIPVMQELPAEVKE